MAVITLTDLNNFMKDYPSGIIVPSKIEISPLAKLFKNRMGKKRMSGLDIEMLIKTSMAYRGKAHTENADLPTPGAPAYVKQLVPIRELITTAGLTKQAMDQATGGDNSWGNVVDTALADMFMDFEWLMELAFFGHGSGAIARVKTGVEDGSTGVYTITCDNTYKDFGSENVGLIRDGMYVDIYNGNTLIGSGTVSATTFGDRANSGTPVDGTFLWTTSTGYTVADNYLVYIHGSKGIMPTGLLDIVQDGTQYTGGGALTTFQNLARASYGCLRGRMYEATNFGLASESPVDGTPCSWDLSVWSDVISDISRGAGRGKVDLILCHTNMSQAVNRRNRVEGGVTVNVSSTGALQQPAVGSMPASVFLAPDGRRIPIEVVDTVPENCVYFLTMADLEWYTLGNFDYLREYGEIWEPSRGDRKTNYEAPYGGYSQLAAERCDNCAVLQDLRTDI